MYNFVFAQQALKPNKPALKHIKKKKTLPGWWIKFSQAKMLCSFYSKIILRFISSEGKAYRGKLYTLDC